MKAIMVMFDSLNRHMLPPYGNDWVKAPNFKRLAEKTVTFDKCYVGSMPCMPARRELHTGRHNFLHRSWGPIEPFDDSMPEILKEKGIYTHLISDHYHYWEDGGATYHNRYSSWEIVRGQEFDLWKGHLPRVDIPECYGYSFREGEVNRLYTNTEEKQPIAKTFKLGLEFLETNHKEDNWFLQLETFDPHEPFYTMDDFKDLYPHEYDGPRADWPTYGRIDDEGRKIREHIVYENAALVSMCDKYLGKVLDFMDEKNMWDDTMLIVNTDHGFLLGEHDYWAKSVCPFYEEISHTPLFIWDPNERIKNQRRDSLVTTIDLPATLLKYFKTELPKDMQGIPLQNVIKNNEKIRDALIFGIHGGQVNCTDGRYVYMRGPENEENKPLYNYTLMPTHMYTLFSLDELKNMELSETFDFTKGIKTMKVPVDGGSNKGTDFLDLKTYLFDLSVDEKQKNPISDRQAEKMMINHLINCMKENDAPIEQYERLGLTKT